MIYVTRRATFSAAHRLYNPTFSAERNEAVFDKCNNVLGHGHNYVIEVIVRGLPDPETGYVIDLKKLRDIIDTRIVDRVDHKHLNFDVDFLLGAIPTVENLCVLFWREIADHLPTGELYCIRLYESDQNYAEYFGAPVDITMFPGVTP
ncbi:MAG: 6-carboxytetrahydropterin synthase [bacterium]|nr:6-carboxytetrahydropterin synthase [bacterium]